MNGRTSEMPFAGGAESRVAHPDHLDRRAIAPEPVGDVLPAAVRHLTLDDEHVERRGLHARERGVARVRRHGDAAAGHGEHPRRDGAQVGIVTDEQHSGHEAVLTIASGVPRARLREFRQILISSAGARFTILHSDHKNPSRLGHFGHSATCFRAN